MNADTYQQIRTVLQRAPQHLSALYAITRDEGSQWSIEQLRLLLEVMDGIEVERDGDDPLVRVGARSPLEELSAAIEAIVRARSAGPIPAQELRRLLPSSFVTTDEQIKALARENSALEVFGPGLIRLNQ